VRHPLPKATGRRAPLGREAELLALDNALERALGGRAQCVPILGEAGIGKTLLADAFAERASARGARVLWGRGWQGGGAPPYWPWVQALRPLRRSRLGQAPEIAGLLSSTPSSPDVAPQAGHAPLEPEIARFRLLDSVALLLEDAADDEPLVIVLDDLHLADRSSLVLLSFVARTLRNARVLVLPSCRDTDVDEAFRACIEGTDEPILLTGLGCEPLRALVHAAGFDAEDAEVDALLAATGGNPLLVDEILRHTRSEGLPLAAALQHVPRTAADILLRRFERLPGDTRQLLRQAAIVGTEIDSRLLADAFARPHDEVGRTLEPARHARIVTAGVTTRFAHTLLRDILHRDATTDERVRVHGEVLRALEARVARGDAIMPHVLFHHAEAADPRGGSALPVELALRAARAAMRSLAFDDAVALLERGSARASKGAVAPELAVVVELELGEALAHIGRIEQGKATCERAVQKARALGDHELFARASLAYGAAFALFIVDGRLVALLSDALNGLGTGDSALAAKVAARLAAAEQPAADPEKPVARALAAIAMARRIGNEAELLEVLHFGIAALMDLCDPRIRKPLNEEALRLAMKLGDTTKELRARARLVIDETELGEAEAAVTHERAHGDLARRTGRERDVRQSNRFAAARAVWEGRFADAEALLELECAPNDTSDLDSEIAYVGLRAGLLRAMGRRDELAAFEPRLTRALAQAGENGAWWSAVQRAGVHGYLGDRAAAIEALSALPSRSPAYPDPSVIGFEASAAAVAGDRPRLEALARVLPSWRHRFCVGGMTMLFCDGPLGRFEAQVLRALGRTDEAIAVLEDAASRVPPRMRPARLRVLLDLADALERRGADGDRARERVVAAEARALAEWMGVSTEAAGREPRPRATPTEARRAADARAPLLTMAREADVWALSFEGTTSRVRATRGMEMLATLVAQPGHAVHVLDLCGSPEPLDVGDAGPLLDERARASYTRRLAELERLVAEAASDADAGRAHALRAEKEALEDELLRAFGLGGRERRAGVAAERARVNAKRRIGVAIDKIREHAPPIAEHLERALRTGTHCVYDPSASRP
jgi:hypothetical protein